MKNIKNVSMKLSFAALTAAMAAAPALNVFAAPEDIIDQNAKASLTIHKYDTTAAEENHVDLSQFTSTGKKDADKLKIVAQRGGQERMLSIPNICTATYWRRSRK